MNITEILEQAASRIKTRGHCKKNGTDGKGFCAWAAITLAEESGTTRDDSDAACVALVNFLHLKQCTSPNGNPNPNSVFDWNDAPERTKDEVVSALLGTAAVWRAMHEEVAQPELIA